MALYMPSLLHTFEQHAFGLKVVAVMPRNPLRNLPRIFASVLLLDVAVASHVYSRARELGIGIEVDV